MDPLTILIIAAIVVIAVAIVILRGRRETVSTDILYSDALNAILKGDNAEAIKLLKQVVSKDSDNLGAYLQLGNLVRSSNPQQAAKIHQSLTVRPKLNKHISKEIHQALALDYADVENYRRAKIEAEMVLKNEKNNLWAHKFLLQIAEKQNDWDQAIALAEKIQKFSGKIDKRQFAKINLQAGKDIAEKGNTRKAIQLLEKAIKIDPGFDQPYLVLADLYDTESNLKKAIVNWEKYLLNTDTSEESIYKKIETALFESKRFNEAEQLYKHILNNKPDDKIAITKLVNSLVDRGEIDEAIKVLDDNIKKSDDSTISRLLKLKLLLDKANPVDLKDQIDEIIGN